MSKLKKNIWIICTTMLFITCSYNRNDYYSINRMKSFKGVEYNISNINLSSDTLSFMIHLKANKPINYFMTEYSKNVFLLILFNKKRKLIRLEKKTSFYIDLDYLFIVKLPKYYDELSFMIIGDFISPSWGLDFTQPFQFDPVGKIESDWYHIKNNK